MFGRKDKTKKIINLIWDESDYFIVTAGKNAPKKKDLIAMGEAMGIELPQDFLAHATGFWGSPYIEVRDDVWLRPEVGDVGPLWHYFHGVFVYAYSQDAPEWMQAKVAVEEFKEMGHAVLPLLRVVGDEDVYCYNQQGEIVKWSNEKKTFEPFDGGFFDLLKYEFIELNERRMKKKEEVMI